MMNCVAWLRTRWPMKRRATRCNPPRSFTKPGCDWSVWKTNNGMGAPMPLFVFHTDQSQPGFVNERGGLQRVARRFIGHLVRSQATQFIIDQRQQLIGGGGIALLRRFKDARDVTHAQ